MGRQITCTAEVAKKLVNGKRRTKHNGYAVFVRPFLPTGDGMGFEGCAMIRVSKKAFLNAINDLLENLGDRGAMIRLNVPTADFESFYI